MTLEDLGYRNEYDKFISYNGLTEFEKGRVTVEHKERYIVTSVKGEVEAEITGNMRFTARGREDFPAVGDWVLMSVYDSDFAIIHKILPRFSIIKRQAPGQYGEVQIIGTNIDYAFIVQSADRDFNINRIERYLTICNSSGVRPVILISKTDLADEARRTEIRESIKTRIENVPFIEISNETKEGYEELKKTIKKGMTYCMLGSSGVGKSTLLNNLSGRTLMRTESISMSTGKGRHVTSHRELFILENGGILIDNPGMREVGIADSAEGLESTFDKIYELSDKCKFSDCTHTSETGCAVIEAVENGVIDKASYANYLKMRREKEYFESTVAERRRKDKIFGKIIKDYLKKDVKQKGR
ncbi:MAG: ribosome small subunit-dependent GTPase A [Bacteroidales bacterium]|nr:ribosome small subunit-dependent GTPase A [Bacteroidales bacterium]